MNRRAITPREAGTLIEDHATTIEIQQTESQANDTMECLNSLLAFKIQTRDADLVIGEGLSTLLYYTESNEYIAEELRNIGIRVEGEGFIVATSHRGLERIYRGTRWQGGLWGHSLERWPNARLTAQRRFGGGARSLAVWLPKDAVSKDEPTAAQRETGF